MTADPTLHQRIAAATLAAEIVRDGMVIGYGTGRAAMAVMDILAPRVRTGLRVLGVPTSMATASHAMHLGLPLTDLDAHPSLDLTIDGADEVDPSRHTIKGGGAALFREKVLAAASRRLVIVIDDSKRVHRLGTTRAIPVEVLPFAVGSCVRLLGEIGGTAVRRLNLAGAPVVTDNGNHILDVAFDAPRMADPRSLDETMRDIPGVIITGLFWSFNPTVVVGTDVGVEVLGPPL
jgi:ribose 5-phosphate isomerase A